MVVDQEGAIREFKNQGVMTARLLFNISSVLAKSLADGAVDISKKVSAKIEARPGEKKSIDALKKRGDTLDYKQFSNNEMNLDKLKAYLKEYGIQFHAEELANGKDLKPQEQIAKHKAAAPKQSVGTKIKKPTKSV